MKFHGTNGISVSLKLHLFMCEVLFVQLSIGKIYTQVVMQSVGC